MQPSEVHIRMYNVGFGDCFLLTFVYPETPDPTESSHRHVLIDFGTMGLPTNGDGTLHTMATIAKDIADTCSSRDIADTCNKERHELTAVVATHRHQDHISGFAGSSGAMIEDLKPKLVLQPWTEHPLLAEDADQPYQHQVIGARFGAMSTELEKALDDRGLLLVPGTDRGREFLNDDFDDLLLSSAIRHHTESIPGVKEAGVKEIAFVGNLNITNRCAVRRLARMGGYIDLKADPECRDGDEQNGGKAEYLAAGDETQLQAELPGVKIHVLGPPTAAEADLAHPARTSDTEFWHLTGGAWGVGLPGLAFDDERQPRFLGDPGRPIECRWVASHISHARPQDLLGIVRDLDGALNNTSLILLFEIWEGDRRRLLLFSGDAQLESWRHCFTQPEVMALLTETDVYKVGHHGSLNATPKKSLWRRFTKRDKGDKGLVTLLSTRNCLHGEKTAKTEVPRSTLVDALRSESRLLDTRELVTAKQPLYLECEVKPDGVHPDPLELPIQDGGASPAQRQRASSQ